MGSEADGSAKGASGGKVWEIHFSGMFLIQTKMQYSVVRYLFPGLFSFNLHGWGWENNKYMSKDNSEGL